MSSFPRRRMLAPVLVLAFGIGAMPAAEARPLGGKPAAKQAGTKAKYIGRKVR